MSFFEKIEFIEMVMPHNRYWELDPSHLSSAELEYELRVRKVFEVGNGSERAKCKFLRDLLAEEGAESRERTNQWPSPLQFENDIRLSEQIIRQLTRWVEVESGDANGCQATWSRVLHIVARVKRMKPRRPADHDRKVKLHLAACELARRVYEAIRNHDRQCATSESTEAPSERPQRHIPASPAVMTQSAASQSAISNRLDVDRMPEGGANRANHSEPVMSSVGQINIERLFSSYQRPLQAPAALAMRSNIAPPRVRFSENEEFIPEPASRQSTFSDPASFDIPSAFNSSGNTTASDRLSGFEDFRGAPDSMNYPDSVSMRGHQGSVQGAAHNIENGPCLANQRNNMSGNGRYANRINWNQPYDSPGRYNQPASNVNRDTFVIHQDSFHFPGPRDSHESTRNEPVRYSDTNHVRSNRYPFSEADENFMYRPNDGYVPSRGNFAHPRNDYRPDYQRDWQPPGGSYGYQSTPPFYGSVPMRKSVPVNQWRISFSGEERSDNKTDLAIHDFLEQVEMFSRAEGIPECELLRQIVHLLNGRARAWYQNVYRRIYTWGDFIAAIKRKFLPLDYHFNVLVEIENRLQRRSEPVGAFINEMELRFRSLPEPLPERHQIHIIRKNFLTDFTMHLANVDIRTVRELEEACKRIECARFMLNARTGRDRNRDKYERPRTNKYLATLSDGSECSEEEAEVAAIQNRMKAKARSASAPREKSSTETKEKAKPAENGSSSTNREIKCVGCGKLGHIRKECEESEVYCFRCGKAGVTVNKCPDCKPSKNSRANQHQVEQIDSPDENTQ